jgi:hypothetical protein
MAGRVFAVLDAKMLNIILALTIVAGASVSLCVLTWGLLELLLETGLLESLAKLLGIPIKVINVPAAVWGAAYIPALFMRNVYDLLEASSAKRALAKTGRQAISVNEFSIHPLAAFLFSLITWSGVFFLTGALMALFETMAEDVSNINIGDSQPKSIFVNYLVAFTASPLRVIAAAYIGRWIGIRSRRYALAIVISSIALGSIADFVWLVLSNGVFKATSNDLAQFLTFLPDIVLFIISGALGSWYGQRRKLAYYLAFILKILPQETRQTIFEMAQDEATRARRPAIQTSS